LQVLLQDTHPAHLSVTPPGFFLDRSLDLTQRET
jgi:hypothetical protein